MNYYYYYYYSGRKAAQVKVSVALSNSFFILGVAMGREIRLRATSYCSRSRFFVLGWHELSFRSRYQILLILGRVLCTWAVRSV